MWPVCASARISIAIHRLILFSKRVKNKTIEKCIFSVKGLNRRKSRCLKLVKGIHFILTIHQLLLLGTGDIRNRAHFVDVYFNLMTRMKYRKQNCIKTVFDNIVRHYYRGAYYHIRTKKKFIVQPYAYQSIWCVSVLINDCRRSIVRVNAVVRLLNTIRINSGP